MSSNKGPTVQVQTTGAFGQQSIKQIELDHNRFDIYAESLSRFANAIAVPTRGIYTDAMLWILTFSVPLRLLDSLALSGFIGDGLAIVMTLGLMLPMVALWAMVWMQLPKLRLACFYRLVLLVFGGLIGTWGIW